MKFETLAYGYGLIEGPRADGAGNLYFSDVTNGGVFRRRPDGTIDGRAQAPRGGRDRPARGRRGRDLGQEHLPREGRRDPHRLREGRRAGLQRPVHRRRGPGLHRLDALEPVQRGGERTPGECYRIEGEGKATELYGGVSLSNGIGFSPDGRTIYHSDTVPGRILVHDLDRDGRSTARAPIRVEGGPDGLAVDAEGGIWVALYQAGAVQRYRPDGKPDARIDVPARAVTSLCFGGVDLRDLYVVSADNAVDPNRGGSIFRTRSDVAGLPAPFARV